MNRRQFGTVLSGAALSQMTGVAGPSSRHFYFAVISDTHIIDAFYRGPESNALDTESIFKTSDRLTAARDFINGLNPPMEKVFLVGDYFHNYPSTEWDFYFQHKMLVVCLVFQCYDVYARIDGSGIYPYDIVDGINNLHIDRSAINVLELDIECFKIDIV